MQCKEEQLLLPKPSCSNSRANSLWSNGEIPAVGPVGMSSPAVADGPPAAADARGASSRPADPPGGVSSLPRAPAGLSSAAMLMVMMSTKITALLDAIVLAGAVGD